MKKIAATCSIILTALILFSSPDVSQAQQKPESVVGAVIAMDLSNRTATIKTDSGATLNVKTDGNTACLRIPAGENSLSKAAPIPFAEIAVGDRVLGHGTRTEQNFLAQRLVVMPASEVARKREHDLEDWKQRGIGGVVRELNPQTAEITLELRGPGAARIVLDTTKATLRRYVAGSLSFEDAQPSTFAAVRPGDQLRALGNRSADARTFAAEQIVSGTFRTIGVTVTEVHPETGSIKATTLDQKQPIEIGINKDSTLRRISPQVAAAIAQKAKTDAAKPASTPVAATPPTQKAMVVDVQQMIDALPTVPVTDIKAGDVLAVTGALETDGSRLVAIKLAAGVDLVLKALAPAPGRAQLVRLSAGLPTVFDFSVIPIN